jgi:hypothetical protein
VRHLAKFCSTNVHSPTRRGFLKSNMSNGASEFLELDFLSKIIDDTQAGHSFVPLIGSGLSSPSGIIMGSEFTSYLAFTAYLVLSDPRKRGRTHGEGKPQRWNLREKGWPPLPSTEERKGAANWVLEQFDDICRRHGLEAVRSTETGKIKSVGPSTTRSVPHEVLANLVYPRIPSIIAASDVVTEDESIRRLADLLVRGATRTSGVAEAAHNLLLSDSTRSFHDRVVEAGVRSLHDWRETLVFLASVEVRDETLVYGAPSAFIIDGFNSFITRDKQPNLGHKMMAHLSGPMRMDLLLTTNFDTLLEDAFRSLNYRIRVLPVSSKGQLPEPRTAISELTLIKLHGETQDTRADLTLGDEPTADDKRSFAAYLSRGAGQRGYEKRVSKRLFVIGYSGNDHRVVEMIKHWLEGNRQAEDGAPVNIVYWVCFTDSGRDRVLKMFPERDFGDAIRVTRSNRPDLLLYELYQRLVLSLPPGGLTYEFAHEVPPRRAVDFSSTPERVENTLSCAKFHLHPIEAARVMLSERGSAQELIEHYSDNAVSELKNWLFRCLKSDAKMSEFFDALGQYKAYKGGFGFRATLWTPIYRDKSAEPKSRSDFEQRGRFEDLRAVPMMVDSDGGVVRAVSLAVKELGADSPTKCLWMETQDYTDADDFLKGLLRTLALRTGCFQGRQVTLHPLSRSIRDDAARGSLKATSKTISEHIQRVLTDYRVDPASIVVLIYGRDSYGPCSGLLNSSWEGKIGDTNSDYHALHCVVEALARVGVMVVYFPLTEARSGKVIKTHVPEEWETRCTESTKWKLSVEGNDKWTEWTHDICVPKDAVLGDDDVGVSIADGVKANSVFIGNVESALAPLFDFTPGRNGKRRATQRPELTSREKGDRLRRFAGFLYGVTLFRHSRHVNALCTEGVLNCPERFNQSGLDNDLLRAREVAGWVQDLRRAGVFYDKPGGTFWMHRDVRMVLQRLLETLDLRRQPDDESGGTAGAGRKVVGNASLIETRARQHIWIGDWYQKAYFSSGHIVPIVESLHHRVMAAVYAPFARFKEIDGSGSQDKKDEAIFNYRRVLFESALVEAQKVLHVSWRSVLVWHASSQGASWLGAEHRKRVFDALQSSLDNLAPNNRENHQWRKRLMAALDGFVESLEELHRNLLLEGGAYPDLPGSSGRAPISAGLFATATNDGVASRRPTPIWHSWRNFNNGTDDNKGKDEFHKQVDALFASPQDSISKLKPVYDAIQEIVKSKGERSTVDMLGQQKGTWKAEWAGDVRAVHDAVELLRDHAYLLLRRAKLKYHALGEVAFKEWTEATVSCNLGIDLCRHFPPWLLRCDLRQRIDLHALYGVGLANMGRFSESNRHFNEAQAILSKLPGASPAELAVIMIRRAESLLTEGEWISAILSVEEDGGSNIIADEVNLVKSIGITKMFGKGIRMQLVGAPKETEIAMPARIAACFRRVWPKGLKKGEPLASDKNNWKYIKRYLSDLFIGTLDEAVSLLDQAASNLSGTSQKSLSWSRLHVLRLRIYGLLETVERMGRKADETLVMRKWAGDAGVYDAFREAFRIAQDDAFRKYRALKYFLRADKWLAGRRTECGPISGWHDSRLPDSYKEARQALIDFSSHPDLGNVLRSRIKVKDGEAGPLLEDSDPDNDANLLATAVAKLIVDWSERDERFSDDWLTDADRAAEDAKEKTAVLKKKGRGARRATKK